MKLDELRTVQSKERRKDSLQQLRDSFYEDVAAYLQDLKASRDRRAKQVENPFSDDEVRRLSDELETAEEVAEAIYERRVGKVVKLASFAAAEMPVDDDGMTTEERDLFEDLVDRIERNKNAVLDVLSGNGESAEQAGAATADAEPTPPPSPTDRAAEPEPATESAADGVLADAMGGNSESTAETAEQATPAAPEQTASSAPETEPTDSSPEEIPPPEAEPEPDAVLGTSTDGGTAADVAGDGPGGDTPLDQPPTASAGGDAEAADDSPDPTNANPDPTDEPGAASDTDGEDRTTVRITKNVGEIFGVDGREYTLRSEDVVTLPTTNADPLVDRDAAMRLD
ncbi:MAG: hypothetical protein U9O06_10055 [Euryarchaeota archaeon]|nr:hypothetical protein [Euryarchaeota archaeon]